MSLKLFVFAAVLAVARAGVFSPVAYHAPLTYAAPVAKAVAVDTDYDPNPQYSYSYDVQDALTGDSKGASETRDGDVVKGSYNFLEADGTRRVVEYTADPVNGYNAVVRNEAAAKVAVVKAAAPVAYHAPIAYHAPVAAYHHPLAYAAPAYHTKVLG